MSASNKRLLYDPHAFPKMPFRLIYPGSRDLLVVTRLLYLIYTWGRRPHRFASGELLKPIQGKQMYIRAEIWPATISHCTSTGLGWPPSDWLSPRPCDTGLAGCSLATDTVDVLLGWRLSLVQNGVSLRLNAPIP